ncbi:MAG TPA: transglutaminase family protein [Devosia sp.]|nr:transglutaminase family protein [Devosia sp.]
MQLTLTHTLKFSLGTPARAVQHLLLTALDTPQQKVERWSIEMPGMAEAAVFRDGFGNRAHLVSLAKPEGEIVVTVSGSVETTDKAGVLGRLEYDPMPAMFRRPTDKAKCDPQLIEGLHDGPDRIALLHELMGRVHAALSGGDQAQSQSADGQSQSQSAGAARTDDFAHAFIGGARGLGIAARHVTGYRFDEDGSNFHGWAEAWDDRLGWIGFDPMHDQCPAEAYVRVASGLDAGSTLPIRSVPVWLEMPAETVELTAQPEPST